MTLAPVIAENAGRRMGITVGALISAVGCLLTADLDFGNVIIFQTGRFLTGFGVCCYALPLYNSEVSAPSIRGATGSLFQVNVVIGQLVASIVTYFNNDWRLGMMLPGIAAVAVALGVWLAPES